LGGEVEFLGGLTYNPNDVQDTGVLVIRSSNIKNGKIIDADNVYVDEDIAVSTKVEIDDIIVVVRNGSRSLIGKHAVVKDNLNAVIGAFMTVIRVDDADFINAVLDSDKFKSEIAKNLGATINQITTGNFRNMKFNFPASRSEKISIGSFFRQMDDLIAAHERKLGLLKKKKTYYLQQIFGQKLRFKGFSEPWEQRKLGQIISITSAVRVHRDEWTSTGIRFFRSSDVAATYRNEPNSSAYISLKRFEELTADSGSPQRGDLLVTGGGSIGIPYVVKDILPLYFKDADLLWLHQTPMLGSKFLYYFLTSPINRRYLAKVSHIGTISHYTIEQASNTPIVIPTVQEQSRISDLLEQLSSLIAVHEQKLSLLKKKKQAYLQKMFV
jgi:type I restriction enzyme S subunit